jgi:hypothetical protein
MQPILQHLFRQNTLSEVPFESLQQLTTEFPYFSVSQYLLARKLKETEDPSFPDQFQKTLIYFNNPLWLQYILSQPVREPEAGVLPGNAEYIPETGNEPVPGTSDLSHDMIEDAVLHQERPVTEPVSSPVAAKTPVTGDAGLQSKQDTAAEIQTIQREEPFAFQAFYTVDYFASQGIKLQQENQQQDKLGKQLKSFTEWLKTMRRLPETSVVEILDKINESEIAQIAAHSLEEKEVITEAMAEVLVKQGKLEKARELYNKLSLQNPHKSTYFAAKIEEIKQH